MNNLGYSSVFQNQKWKFLNKFLKKKRAKKFPWRENRNNKIDAKFKYLRKFSITKNEFSLFWENLII